MVADRVIFACPCNAAMTMLKKPDKRLEETVMAAPVYADDHHPATGHMHAVMHSDPSVIDEQYRSDFLDRGSNTNSCHSADRRTQHVPSGPH